MYGIIPNMKKSRNNEEVTLASIAKSLERLPTKTDLEKSVEGLAIMTANGFEKTVSKTDFAEFRDEMTDFKKKTGMTLFNMDSKLQTVDQRLDAIEKTLGPLVHVSNAVQRELREHNERIVRIEQKMGLVK